MVLMVYPRRRRAARAQPPRGLPASADLLLVWEYQPAPVDVEGILMLCQHEGTGRHRWRVQPFAGIVSSRTPFLWCLTKYYDSGAPGFLAWIQS